MEITVLIHCLSNAKYHIVLHLPKESLISKNCLQRVTFDIKNGIEDYEETSKYIRIYQLDVAELYDFGEV